LKLMINLVFSIFLFAVLTSLDAQVKVVTTTTDLKDIAQQIGKDKVEVYSMIRGIDDPHFVMTRPDFLVKLNKADVFCQIGLDLEIGWVPLLLQQARNIKIQKGQPGFCDTSSGIKILGEPTTTVDRSMGDIHIYGNPHYWNDPIHSIQMANTIMNTLTRVDPKNGDFYKQNYQTYRKEMIQLVKEEMVKFKPYFGRQVAVFHDQFVYLANRFKFTANLSIEERPGVPPSVRYMNQIIEYMKENRIKVILISPFHNPKYAEYVSSKVPGSIILTLPVSVDGLKEDASTYQEATRTTMKLIREALEKTK
jgi:zinc/manganese transport system substrate-binding protein